MKNILSIPFITACLTIYSTAAAQTIDYRNDSLFINNSFVDSKISTSQLNNLLHSKGRTAISKDEDIITGKTTTVTSVFFDSLGIFFRKYKHNRNALTIWIKLKDQTGKGKEGVYELPGSYKGSLVIIGNEMIGKITATQLQHLKNCTVMFRGLRTSSGECISEGEISDGESVITFYFDASCGEVSAITIDLHH